jgi:hypothetical protein
MPTQKRSEDNFRDTFAQLPSNAKELLLDQLTRLFFAGNTSSGRRTRKRVKKAAE